MPQLKLGISLFQALSQWGVSNAAGQRSWDIICSSKLTVFLELRSRKTFHFSEQTMSADKYTSIFLRQTEATVEIVTHGYANIGARSLNVI